MRSAGSNGTIWHDQCHSRIRVQPQGSAFLMDPRRRRCTVNTYEPVSHRIFLFSKEPHPRALHSDPYQHPLHRNCTPWKPTFLPRPPDTPLAAAVATVSPTPQEAELTPEERSDILGNLDQQQSGKKIGWMPDVPPSRPSEKIDHTKCGLPVVEEPPPEVVIRLLAEFPDVFAELPKGLPKYRPTDHSIVVDETQTRLPTDFTECRQPIRRRSRGKSKNSWQPGESDPRRALLVQVRCIETRRSNPAAWSSITEHSTS